MAAPPVASIGTLNSGTGANRTPGIPTGITSAGHFRIFLAGINANNTTSNPSVTPLIKTGSANLPNIEIWYGFSPAAEGPGNYALNVESGLSNADAQAARIIDVPATSMFFGTVDNQRGANTAAPMAVSLAGVPAGSTLFWFCYTTANRTTPVPSGFTRKSSNTQIRHHWATLENWGGGDTGSITAGNFVEATATNRVVLFAILPNSQTVSVTGFAPAVVFGTPTLIQTQSVSPTGFAPAVTFGTPTLIQDQFVQPTGFTVNVDFGTPTLIQDQFLSVSGFAPTVDFGTPTLTQEVTPTGFTVTVDFGTPTLVQDQFVNPTGFAPSVDFGAPALVQMVDPDGFELLVEFGTPTVILDNVLLVTGFAINVNFGSPLLALQPVVAGVVRNHETGAPVGAGVVVKLFDDNDLLVDTTTTDAGGTFVFHRPIGDTDLYWTLAEYDVLGVQYHGVSDRGCPAV